MYACFEDLKLTTMSTFSLLDNNHLQDKQYQKKNTVNNLDLQILQLKVWHFTFLEFYFLFYFIFLKSTTNLVVVVVNLAVNLTIDQGLTMLITLR